MLDIDTYEKIVDRMHRKLTTCSDICRFTSPEEDWSIIELVSHLVDSASNNHQRFIRLQYEKELFFPGYDAEAWRNISKMRDADYAQMVELWKTFNWYLIELLKRMDPAALSNCWNTDGRQLSLQFLVEDYFGHLLWHEKLFDDIAVHARSNP